ncbi:hypothetical protein C0992_009764 [Termitomyces sp. T32_za158]|nr:hypothetical protein C0992_009764 [Termitomyces sp. T32_za158]
MACVIQMTVLEPEPQLPVATGTTIEKAIPKHRDDGRGYEHLLKDIPYDVDGNPYISIRGFDQMFICVGSRACPGYGDPVGYIQEFADYVRSTQLDCKFDISAEYRTGSWPLGLGFQRLGEFLAFLDDEEIGFERWHRLTISLPDLELPYDILSSPMLPLNAFTNLRDLIWKGHRKQLLASWLPLSPSVLETLNTLEIQCDIALQDCCYLLYHCTNLQNVTLKIIQKALAHESVFGFVVPSGHTSRPLEYLCLVSDDDIGPLLRPFNFPLLRHIDFRLGYPTWSTLSDLMIWKTLEKAHYPVSIQHLWRNGEKRKKLLA